MNNRLFDIDFGKRSDQNVSIEKQIQKENKLVKIGEVWLHSGHKLFAVNKKTAEVKQAQFQGKDLTWEMAVKYMQTGNSVFLLLGGGKLVVEDGWYYTSALNEENAIRHFNRDFKNKQK